MGAVITKRGRLLMLPCKTIEVVSLPTTRESAAPRCPLSQHRKPLHVMPVWETGFCWLLLIGGPLSKALPLCGQRGHGCVNLQPCCLRGWLLSSALGPQLRTQLLQGGDTLPVTASWCGLGWHTAPRHSSDGASVGAGHSRACCLLLYGTR